MKALNVIDLGILPHEETYFIQKNILIKKKLCRCEDYVILVEHPNIFTIGRSGSRKNILVNENFLNDNRLKVIEVNRGGDITFHGFGQLVAYPIFDLRNHTKDVRLFIRNLENVLKLTIAEYGLSCDKEKRCTGLWVNGSKIGFIGVGISNWITYHGVSINANVDLKYFYMIRPCGIDNLQVSSLQEILNSDIDLNSLKDIFVEKCCEVFGFECSYRYSENASVAKERTS